MEKPNNEEKKAEGAEKATVSQTPQEDERVSLNPSEPDLSDPAPQSAGPLSPLPPQPTGSLQPYVYPRDFPDHEPNTANCQRPPGLDVPSPVLSPMDPPISDSDLARHTYAYQPPFLPGTFTTHHIQYYKPDPMDPKRGIPNGPPIRLYAGPIPVSRPRLGWRASSNHLRQTETTVDGRLTSVDQSVPRPPQLAQRDYAGTNSQKPPGGSGATSILSPSPPKLCHPHLPTTSHPPPRIPQAKENRVQSKPRVTKGPKLAVAKTSKPKQKDKKMSRRASEKRRRQSPSDDSTGPSKRAETIPPSEVMDSDIEPLSSSEYPGGVIPGFDNEPGEVDYDPFADTEDEDGTLTNPVQTQQRAEDPVAAGEADPDGGDDHRLGLANPKAKGPSKKNALPEPFQRTGLRPEDRGGIYVNEGDDDDDDDDDDFISNRSDEVEYTMKNSKGETIKPTRGKASSRIHNRFIGMTSRPSGGWGPNAFGYAKSELAQRREHPHDSHAEQPMQRRRAGNSEELLQRLDLNRQHDNAINAELAGGKPQKPTTNAPAPTARPKRVAAQKKFGPVNFPTRRSERISKQRGQGQDEPQGQEEPEESENYETPEQTNRMKYNCLKRLEIELIKSNEDRLRALLFHIAHRIFFPLRSGTGEAHISHARSDLVRLATQAINVLFGNGLVPITGQVWRRDFSDELKRPTLDVGPPVRRNSENGKLDFCEPGTHVRCSVCGQRHRVGSSIGFSGTPFASTIQHHDTGAMVLNSDDEMNANAHSHPVRFNIGRRCMELIEIYHTLRHWERVLKNWVRQRMNDFGLLGPHGSTRGSATGSAFELITGIVKTILEEDKGHDDNLSRMLDGLLKAHYRSLEIDRERNGMPFKFRKRFGPGTGKDKKKDDSTTKQKAGKEKQKGDKATKQKKGKENKGRPGKETGPVENEADLSITVGIALPSKKPKSDDCDSSDGGPPMDNDESDSDDCVFFNKREAKDYQKKKEDWDRRRGEESSDETA